MKNKFTVQDSAMLLIDHQQGTIKLARNIAQDEIIRNTRALARTAVETGMPLVLTTSMEDHFQGPLLTDLQELAPAAYADRVKRPGVVDCWEFEPYRTAVEATGKKKLIMAGLTNDVCIVYPSISAVEDGYEVQVVVDAGGSPSLLADETALRRMERHGVTLTSTNQLMAELAVSWSEAHGATIQDIMYQEILKHYVEAA
ncbi:MAG: isochorismatase family protein [Armatimonadaceae bacterium]